MEHAAEPNPTLPFPSSFRNVLSCATDRFSDLLNRLELSPPPQAAPDAPVEHPLVVHMTELWPLFERLFDAIKVVPVVFAPHLYVILTEHGFDVLHVCVCVFVCVVSGRYALHGENHTRVQDCRPQPGTFVHAFLATHRADDEAVLCCDQKPVRDHALCGANRNQ